MQGGALPIEKHYPEIAQIEPRPYLHIVSSHKMDMASVLKMIREKQAREAFVMSITCDLMAHI